MSSSLLLPPPSWNPPLPKSSPISPLPRWSGLRTKKAPNSRSPAQSKIMTTNTPVLAISHQFPSSAASSPLLFVHLLNPSPSAAATVAFAGRSKKKKGSGGGGGPGRIEGNADVRREAKSRARLRSRRLAENLFYRRNRAASASNFPDSFTDDELQAIGLGYDRAVRFMSKDDPRLRHPFDWYKYGQYGPYSWRGIVVGPPIRGRFSDDRVSLYGEVRDHEEWEKIEQFEMASEYCRRLDAEKGLRHYWVFVRHPRWRPTEQPWQQWTLAAEVAMEAGTQRLDKWNLMARLGNRTRAEVTQCAAWVRPDIIYVKKPVYQCRFEPQDDFFNQLRPLVDPSTENSYPCELRHEDGRIETCTYFGGLCKLLKISPKAYVDDVVNAYQRLNDEAESRCLEFLLTNHPTELLHPYTKEWKAKLEEMELGCDAPDDSDDDDEGIKDEMQEVTDWVEDDEEIDNQTEDDEVVMLDDEDGSEEAETNPEETEEYWNEQWKMAMKSSEDMEKLVKRSIELSNEKYKKYLTEEKQREVETNGDDDDDDAVDDLNIIELNSPQNKEEWLTVEQESAGYTEEKNRVTRKIPPQLYLRSSVRPFTYRNLVKEIVLTRHAILDGDIAPYK